MKYPALWVGFSAYPKDMQRPWIEVTPDAIRIGEIKYHVSIHDWRPFQVKSHYRHLRRNKRFSQEASRACCEWEIWNNKTALHSQPSRQVNSMATGAFRHLASPVLSAHQFALRRTT